MSGLHPQYMLSKRFPVHAAIELQDLKSIATLLGNQKDARYHFDRKLTNNEVSILHQACCARTTARRHWVDIVRVCIKLGANVNDVDCIGQTPLFYAIAHCQAREIVPLLVEAGCLVNQARWSDKWTALHLAAMMGLEKIVEMLLNSGADPKLETEEGFDASQMALNNHFPHIAKLIKSSKKKIKQETQISKTVNEAENISIFQSNNFIVPQSGSTPSHNSYNYNAPMDHSELGDEVSWALQMKKDLEEKKKNEETVKKRKNDESENDGDNKVSKTSSLKRKTQEEKLRELKAKIEEEEKRKSNPCQEEQMVNILEVMEKKRQRRMASKNKLTEKERLEKEQALVKQAMYDEIIWALQLQKDIAEQCGNIEDVEKYEKQILLEQEKKDGTHERRLKQKQKEEEEKIRQEKLAEERKKQEEIRKQEEIKRKKELAAIRAEEQRKMEIEFQRKKEQEAFERLPQWKKDKILREKNKDKDGSPTSMAIDQTKSNQDERPNLMWNL